jgi:hypothetical protein
MHPRRFFPAPRVGSHATDGANCGAWYWNANNAASNANWNFAARLLMANRRNKCFSIL